MNKPLFDVVSFEGKVHKCRTYTDDQEKTMNVLRQIAVKQELPDFYTGTRFSNEYKPTIEHVFPHQERSHAKKLGLKSINDLENLTFVGSKTNGEKAARSLKNWYKTHPEYVENGKKHLKPVNRLI